MAIQSSYKVNTTTVLFYGTGHSLYTVYVLLEYTFTIMIVFPIIVVAVRVFTGISRLGLNQLHSETGFY